jgi:hypothetical protein
VRRRRGPAAQPDRRRIARRDGIGPPKQQIEGRNEWHHSRHAVEDEKQYRLYWCLSDYFHLFVLLAVKAQKSSKFSSIIPLNMQKAGDNQYLSLLLFKFHQRHQHLPD